MKIFNTLILIFCVSSFFTKAYAVESKFSASYRCQSNYSGGINHDANGHRATAFNSREEFRLTHINDLKPSTLEAFEGLESQHKVVLNYDWLYQESRAHYFRTTTTPEEDAFFSPPCESFGKVVDGVFVAESISCNNSNILFNLNVETRRFIYAYLGSYHPDGGDKPKKYYGDSSVFEYGTCSPYYD